MLASSTTAILALAALLAAATSADCGGLHSIRRVRRLSEATSPDLERLSACSAKCKLSFVECHEVAVTKEDRDECTFNNLVSCSCNCRRFLGGAGAVLRGSDWLRGLAGLAELPLLKNRDSSAAGAAQRCYKSAFSDLMACAGSSKAPQDADQPAKCAQLAFNRVCVCSPKSPPSARIAHVAEATTPAPAAPLAAPRSLDDVLLCNTKCLASFDTCRSQCQINEACLEQCANEWLADCNCRCGQYLDSRSSLLAFAASFEAQPPLALETDLVRHGGDRAINAIQCYNGVIQTLQICVQRCNQDNDCNVKCARKALEDVCNCNPAKRQPSASAKTAQATVLAVVTGSLLALLARA